MKALLIVLLLVAPVEAQKVVNFAWDANPATDAVQGYRFVVDSTISDVGNVTTFSGTFQPGDHIASVLAYNALGVSPPSVPVSFTIAPQTDPCTPPLGAHAPAIFPTSPQFTGSKGPGSRAFLNYQLGGPDRVTEVAIQVDGADSSVGRATGPTDDLKAFSGMWFTQPSVGSHTLGVRVLTSFGCSLVRQTSLPLVVK
jgi:hypothetical protein